MIHRLFEDRQLAILQFAKFINLPSGELAIGLAGTVDLPIKCPAYPSLYSPTAVSLHLCAAIKQVGCHWGNLYLNIDSIQQRSGYPATITTDLFQRATTASQRITQVTTRAGIHGRDQLKVCRKFGLPGGAGDQDTTGFQGFTQDF